MFSWKRTLIGFHLYFIPGTINLLMRNYKWILQIDAIFPKTFVKMGNWKVYIFIIKDPRSCVCYYRRAWKVFIYMPRKDTNLLC